MTKRFTTQRHHYYDNDSKVAVYHHKRSFRPSPEMMYKLERESVDGGTVICPICHNRFTVTACVWARRSWLEEPQYFCKYCASLNSNNVTKQPK